ncbi:MAG: universal stress protein [Rhodospirillales bacterium]|nr:universal stress protein [Rhodospirillales bacterium]
MKPKDILVHQDGGERDVMLLQLALGLAKRFEARLTALFSRPTGRFPLRQDESECDEPAGQAQRVFLAAIGQEKVEGRFWRLKCGDPGAMLAETVFAARFFDLVVLGQFVQGAPQPDEFVEQVILQSGRPCLVVPAVGAYPVVGTNVLIAWNGGREATRALHDSLALIKGAECVEILRVHANVALTASPAFASLRDYLDTHGITAISERLAGEDIGVMDLILSRSFDLGANLLVMGAHGGYHLPFLRGAGTRHILRHMTLPVLMAC